MTEWDPPLTRGEAQARALMALDLEEHGTPLEQAIQEGDSLIACRRAYGHETPFVELPDIYGKRW